MEWGCSQACRNLLHCYLPWGADKGSQPCSAQDLLWWIQFPSPGTACFLVWLVGYPLFSTFYGFFLSPKRAIIWKHNAPTFAHFQHSVSQPYRAVPVRHQESCPSWLVKDIGPPLWAAFPPAWGRRLMLHIPLGPQSAVQTPQAWIDPSLHDNATISEISEGLHFLATDLLQSGATGLLLNHRWDLVTFLHEGFLWLWFVLKIQSMVW